MPLARTYRYLIYALLLLGLVLAYALLPDFRAFLQEAWRVLSEGEVEAVQAWVRQQGAWAPVVLVLGFTVQMFMIVVPSWLLMLVCVLLYGPWVGSLLSLTGMLTASTVGYWVGHWLDDVTLERMVGEDTEQKLARYVEQYGLWTVVLFRLVPFLSNDAISFVAGLLEMRFWRFIGASVLGLLPLTAALAWLGQYDDRLQTIMWITSGVALLGAATYYGWQAWQRRRP